MLVLLVCPVCCVAGPNGLAWIRDTSLTNMSSLPMATSLSFNGNRIAVNKLVDPMECFSSSTLSSTACVTKVSVFEWRSPSMKWVQLGSDINSASDLVGAYFVSISGDGSKVMTKSDLEEVGVSELWVHTWDGREWVGENVLRRGFEGYGEMGKYPSMSSDGMTISFGTTISPGNFG